MKLTHYPQPSLHHENVKVCISGITDGDSGRGFVPGYHFRILNLTGEDVGHINFRVGNTEHVRMAAGHIGYKIKEEHRGNGYAGDACLAIAPFVAKIYDEVRITVDSENAASIRVLEKIGARYEDEVDVPKGDPHYERGTLRMTRYVWRLC